jgi:UDP-N-acetylmuramate: L-alanyl-gamma-D-glutamyl-meso-diaminopimelate ligase
VTAEPGLAARPEDDGNVVADVDPGRVRRVHFLGVAGTGMGSLAGMLGAAGWEVTGSDQAVYPPMSDMPGPGASRC